MSEKNYCIVIPCFNEEKRLHLDQFKFFLEKNPNTTLAFVDDGSSDNTFQVLESLKSYQNVLIYKNSENVGKGGAVYKGINSSLGNNYSFYGFLDADLATPLSELERLLDIISQVDVALAYGSRKSRESLNIKRDPIRYILSFLFTVFTRGFFQIPISDTQCGIKVFNESTAKEIFSKPFVSRWLFDIEIFLRFFKNDGTSALEFPLRSWTEVEREGVSNSFLKSVLIDIFKIIKSY